ncbi:MAG: Ig-like domain-containing protein, partial [Pseudomonadota bacterium]
DSFTVIVTDSAGLTDEVTVNVQVNPAPDAPEGDDLTVFTNEDEAVSGTIVMRDPDAGDTPEATVRTGPSEGIVVLQPNGAFTYTPYANFSGTDSFSVTVTDDTGRTDTAVVTIEVSASNDAPVITSNSGSNSVAIDVAENTSFVTTVVATDDDIGDTPTYAIVGGLDAGLFEIDATSGELTLRNAPDFENPQGATPDNLYEVVVEASDGNGGADQQIINVTVTDDNDAPVITSNGGGPTADIFLDENTNVVTTLASSDPDTGDTITYTIVGGASASSFSIDETSGELRFVAGPDFENPTDNDGNNDYVVEVSATDASGDSDTQLITVFVADINEAPTVTGPGSITTPENTQTSGSITISDPDAGDSPTASIGTAATNGTATVTPSGSFTYQPHTGFSGSDSFTIIVTDDDGLTDTVTIAVTVTGTNAPPEISATSLTTSEDSAATDRATITDPDPGDTYVASIASQPSNGSATVTPSGEYTYTPEANFFGTDSFVVKVTDNHGATDSVTVNVTVDTVNDAPEATGGSKTGTAREPMTFTAADFGYTDIESDPLTSVTLTNLALSGGTLTHSGGTLPVLEGETLTRSQLDSLVFNPGPNGAAREVSFTYRVNDMTSGSSTATMQITLAAATATVPKEVVNLEPETGPEILPALPQFDDEEEPKAPEVELPPAAIPAVALPVIAVQEASSTSTAAPVAAREAVVAREVAPEAVPLPVALETPISAPTPLPIREPVIEPVREPIRIARSPITFTPVDQVELTQQIDQLGEDVRDYDEFLGVAVDKVSFAFGSLLSVGGVSFALRGGVLAAALMSAVPAWNRFDPISVVRKDEEEEDLPVETLADTMRAAIDDARSRVNGMA